MTNRLLDCLREHASGRGLVIVRERQLLGGIPCSALELRRGLDELEKRGELEVFSPPPFLVVKLKVWPGKDQFATKAGPSVPYSYSFQQSRLNKSNSYSFEGSDHQVLLQGILDALGESDPAAFQGVLQHYSPTVIRTALARVRSAKSIRKNRTALFRYLLPKIAKESLSSAK